MIHPLKYRKSIFESNMRTLFISDLHLSEQTPHINELFFKFLATQTENIDALYILGDFFELWIGDDDISLFHAKIAQEIAKVAKHCPVYFMHGNRDFLIGKRFATQCNMHILHDPSVVNLYGKNILLMHGDILCTDDKAYQKYRKIVHTPIIQKFFLSLPLNWRKKIAHKLRQNSQQHHQQYNTGHLVDACPNTVNAYQAKYQCTTLIHGHTHQPAIHHKSANTRAVLGAWHEIGNYLEYNDNHCIFLRSFYI